MKESNQKRWDVLVGMIKDPIRKGQFDKFVEYLKEHSSYFVAPASPGYHCSWDEGLLEHCLNVAENAVRINRALKAELNEEELIIGALFHDLGKAYISEDEPYYKIKVPTPAQVKNGYVPYPPYEYSKAGQVFMTVPQRSVRLITQFIDISDALYQAILIHDGQYPGCHNDSYACKESSMALIMHYADSWSGFILEGKTVQSENGKAYEVDYDDKVGNHGFDVRVNQSCLDVERELWR